jgi:uncharacterized membrane protein YhaH (DUF805 family)
MEQSSGFGSVIFALISIALIIFLIASLWKVFTKAGKPGWFCLIPFFNLFVMVQIAGRPWWWFLLFFVPIINMIVSIIIPFDMAKRFGKGIGFGFGLLFLSFIFYPIIAFDDSVYIPAVPA